MPGEGVQNNRWRVKPPAPSLYTAPRPGVHSGGPSESCFGGFGSWQRNLGSFECLLRLAAEVPQVQRPGHHHRSWVRIPPPIVTV
jgi:hypothetical protein